MKNPIEFTEAVFKTLFPGVVERSRERTRRAFQKELEALLMFAPSGGGPYPIIKELTLRAANQTFPFARHLIEVLDVGRVREIPAEQFCSEASCEDAAHQLKALFDRYKSDKADDRHGYQYVYAPVLHRREEVTALLEFGLGTPNVDIPGNMGEQGQPGASLRAFRAFLPKARMYGADIDKRVLFEEDRIQTCFVDQTDLSSFDGVASLDDREFDLIIDDGLHSPNANIAVLAFGIRRIKANGWIIVEDIRPEAASIWHTIAAILPDRFESYLFTTKGGPVFGVRRMA